MGAFGDGAAAAAKFAVARSFEVSVVDSHLCCRSTSRSNPQSHCWRYSIQQKEFEELMDSAVSVWPADHADFQRSQMMTCLKNCRNCWNLSSAIASAEKPLRWTFPLASDYYQRYSAEDRSHSDSSDQFQVLNFLETHRYLIYLVPFAVARHLCWLDARHGCVSQHHCVR